MTAHTVREQTIIEMCMTWRHDFGLTKINEDSPFESGMSNREREALIGQMSQLYDHHIAPVQRELDDLRLGNSIVVPKDQEHAVAMLRLASFYLDQQAGNGKS